MKRLLTLLLCVILCVCMVLPTFPAYASQKPVSLLDWGAHTYITPGAETVMSNVYAGTNGAITVEGRTAGGNGELGVTYLHPIDLEQGFSVEFGLDRYWENGTNGVDSWISLQITDSPYVTDENNQGAYSRQFKIGGDPVYGSGLMILMRPEANGVLNLGEIYWNGVALNGSGQPYKANSWRGDAYGCYAKINVGNFSRIKLEIAPQSDGGVAIRFNNGNFTRVGGNRIDSDGRINPGNTYSALRQYFNASRPAYASVVYHHNVDHVTPQFRIYKIDGQNAVTANTKTNLAGVYELLPDTHFEDGFAVLNMDNTTGTPYYFTNNGTASQHGAWRLLQQASKYSFRDESVTTSKVQNGLFVYENPSKRVTVDTATGTIGMRVNASQVYDHDRQYFEDWPHLLLDCRTQNTHDFETQLQYMDHLRLRCSVKLTYFDDLMGDRDDWSLHASQFLLYLYVHATDANGNDNMLFLGVPLFDNRQPELVTESFGTDEGKEDATHMWVYSIPTYQYTDTRFHKNGEPVGSVENEWMEIDVDLLPYAKRAFALAQQQGAFPGVTFSDLYIDGMNVGWEVPGTYDCEMQMKDMSLQSYVDTTYGPSFGARQGSGLTYENGFLYDIPVGTTPAQLISMLDCPAGCSLRVVDAKGAAATSLFTGARVIVSRIVEGNDLQQVVCALRGDVNGNGKLDSNDMFCIRSGFLHTGSWQKYQKGTAAFLAADVNKNGKLDSNDYIQCKMVFLNMLTW